MKQLRAALMNMPDRKQALVLMLAAALPLAAQQPGGTRRPGGGAGMDYKAYDSAMLDRGKSTFAAKCGFCHGSNARGGESGPDLLRSPLVRDDEDGNQIGQVVRSGRPAAGMPKFDLSKSEISDIAAFLHDGVRAAAERGTYKVLNIVTGDPKAGEAYFNGVGQCTMCHSVSGDLKGVGTRYDPLALQSKLLMPAGGREGQKRNMAQVTVTVTLASGKQVEGTLERMDDFNIALTDANGDYHSFNRNGNLPKVELHDPLKHHYDMLSKFTDADIHNLTAYLVTLK